ncbi:MAG: helix-turn-helix domain-containing protein [Pseudonocardiaceae bacterium]
MQPLFGIRLRESRSVAEMSLGELAKRIHYSKGYLSKIENGTKPPSAILARLCDDVLDASGALVALVPASAAVAAENDIDDIDGEVWIMSLDDTGGLRFQPVDRRHVLITGASALAGFAVTRGGSSPTVDERIVPEFRAAFDQVRRLGVLTSPALVLPLVATHLNALRTYAVAAEGRYRSELLLLASRFAEYAGWMGQEAGDERAALWWTETAVRLAAAGGDNGMARYALVRQAEIALYRHDATTTIELARRAQNGPAVPPRILGSAARCEAQGHALNGDHGACLRSLDRAATLLDAASGEPDSGPVLGSANTPDPVSLATGWSLYDLGQPAKAADVLDREVARILPTARRPRARFGVRRALAHAVSGEVDHACALAHEALLDYAHVDSATIRLDLRQLSRTLSRWRGHQSVRDLTPSITAALHATPGGPF